MLGTFIDCEEFVSGDETVNVFGGDIAASGIITLLNC
jgi:hypothetical protein